MMNISFLCIYDCNNILGLYLLCFYQFLWFLHTIFFPSCYRIFIHFSLLHFILNLSIGDDRILPLFFSFLCFFFFNDYGDIFLSLQRDKASYYRNFIFLILFKFFNINTYIHIYIYIYIYIYI